MRLFELRGKRAFISGSSRGLGLALARGLGEAGAELVLNSRREEDLGRAAKALKADGINCSYYAFDVCDSTAVEDNINKIEEEQGTIDILINNAGINLRNPADNFPEDKWHKVIELNLNAMFYVSKAVGSRMAKRKKGKIINMASLLSEAARPGISAYTASKGGVKMYTKALAVEWAKYNIQVNAIGPGYFHTEMTESLINDPDFDKWVKERTPAGRWGRPEELVGAVVFFASSASDFITGQIMYVDGGWLAAL